MSEDLLIEQIYASVAAPGRLAGIMASVGHALQAESAFLFTSHSVSSPAAMLLGHNMDTQTVDDFASTWCHEDVWAHQAAQRGMMRRNVVVTGDELVTKKDLHRSVFYNEYGKRAGMDAMLGTVLFDGTERGGTLPFTNLCWYRSAGKKRFSAEDTRRLRPLMPHLQRALLLHNQLHQLSVECLLAGASAGRPALASLVINAEARIVAHNANTQRLLSGNHGLVKTVDGRIIALGRKAAPSIEEALALCKRTGEAVRLVTQEVAGGRLTRATLSVIAPDADNYVGVFAQPHYLLIIELPGESDMDLVHQATRLYDLTASETAVVMLLLQGLTVEQAALERGSSVNTVRSQVRALLHKTGHERQVDMLCTLGQLMG